MEPSPNGSYPHGPDIHSALEQFFNGLEARQMKRKRKKYRRHPAPSTSARRQIVHGQAAAEIKYG